MCDDVVEAGEIDHLLAPVDRVLITRHPRIVHQIAAGDLHGAGRDLVTDGDVGEPSLGLRRNGVGDCQRARVVLHEMHDRRADLAAGLGGGAHQDTLHGLGDVLVDNSARAGDRSGPPGLDKGAGLIRHVGSQDKRVLSVPGPEGIESDPAGDVVARAQRPMLADALFGLQHLAQVVAGQELFEDTPLRYAAQDRGEGDRRHQPVVSQSARDPHVVVREVMVLHCPGEFPDLLPPDLIGVGQAVGPTQEGGCHVCGWNRFLLHAHCCAE